MSDVHKKSKHYKIRHYIEFQRENENSFLSLFTYWGTLQTVTKLAQKNFIRLKSRKSFREEIFFPISRNLKPILQNHIKAKFSNVVRNEVLFMKVHTISFKMIYNLSHLDQFEILA